MKLKLLRPSIRTLGASLQTLKPYPVSEKRLRGRAGQTRRQKFLDQHPLCLACEKVGRVGPAVIADHRKPLWAGGADDLASNGNPLCQAHSDAKTGCEARMRAAGGWLSTPCICGQHG